MHGEVTKNVNQTHVKQKKTYATHKGKQLCEGFKEGKTYVKMKKPKKKKSLAFSWEGPFLFVKYLNGNKYIEHDEGGRIYAVKGEKI